MIYCSRLDNCSNSMCTIFKTSDLRMPRLKNSIIERTNEKKDFVPYMERIKNEKELKKQQEGEEPTLKSFKD